MDLHQELEAKWTFPIGSGRFPTVKVGAYRGRKFKKSIDGTDNTFITKGTFKLVHDLAKVIDGVLVGGRYRRQGSGDGDCGTRSWETSIWRGFKCCSERCRGNILSGSDSRSLIDGSGRLRR